MHMYVYVPVCLSTRLAVCLSVCLPFGYLGAENMVYIDGTANGYLDEDEGSKNAGMPKVFKRWGGRAWAGKVKGVPNMPSFADYLGSVTPSKVLGEINPLS